MAKLRANEIPSEKIWWQDCHRMAGKMQILVIESGPTTHRALQSTNRLLQWLCPWYESLRLESTDKLKQGEIYLQTVVDSIRRRRIVERT